MPPKRNYRKKRNNKKRGSTYNRNKIGLVGPLVQKTFTKLCYETGNLGTVVSTSIGTATFRLNSLYDPQYAVGGHQPRGFDQMATIYGIYRVLGVGIKLYGSLITPGSGVVGYSITSSSTAPGDINSYMETRNSKYRIITADKPAVIKSYQSIAKAFGTTKEVVRSDDNFAAGVGSDPTSVPYIHFFWQANDENATQSYNIRACLEFYTLFTHPNVLAQS